MNKSVTIIITILIIASLATATNMIEETKPTVTERVKEIKTTEMCIDTITDTKLELKGKALTMTDIEQIVTHHKKLTKDTKKDKDKQKCYDVITETTKEGNEIKETKILSIGNK